MSTAAPHFDARLIPEYDGTGDVVSWLTRAEMLCQLKGVAAAAVIPLRLAGGAFHVWSQLSETDRCSLEVVRGALYSAFALDQYAAYETFAARRLMPGEAADVFLADLRRLAALFGGLTGAGVGLCVRRGVAGRRPPDHPRRLQGGRIGPDHDFGSRSCHPQRRKDFGGGCSPPSCCTAPQ